MSFQDPKSSSKRGLKGCSLAISSGKHILRCLFRLRTKLCTAAAHGWCRLDTPRQESLQRVVCDVYNYTGFEEKGLVTNTFWPRKILRPGKGCHPEPSQQQLIAVVVITRQKNFRDPR